MNSLTPIRIDIEGLGSNAVQQVDISLDSVQRVCLTLGGEGAVTQVSFCPGRLNSEVSGVPAVAESNATANPSGATLELSGRPLITMQPSSPSVRHMPSSTPSDAPSGEASVNSADPTVDGWELLSMIVSPLGLLSSFSSFKAPDFTFSTKFSSCLIHHDGISTGSMIWQAPRWW